MQKPVLERKMGPPGMNATVTVKLPNETIRAIDRWARRDEITRSEAIRQLLTSALAASSAAAKIYRRDKRHK